MRNVILLMHVSLNGFVARPNRELTAAADTVLLVGSPKTTLDHKCNQRVMHDENNLCDHPAASRG